MDRILHINDYPIDAGGGAEVILRQTMALQERHGLAVSSFTSADLPETRLTPLRYLDNRLARAALNLKLEAFAPKLIHLHNYYHILSPGILDTLAEYKATHHVRVVMTAHDYHLACPNSGGNWFRWWSRRCEAIEPMRTSWGSLLTRRWDHRTMLHSLLKLGQHLWNYQWKHRHQVLDLVICPSRFVEAMLAPTGLRTHWLPHAVRPLAVAPRRSGPLNLVFAGRIEPEKGLNDLLQLLPADFDGRFTIIGDGSQRAACQATCERRGWAERVEFVGRLPHNETVARIAACHVLVQPSRMLETYGLSLIEALSGGTNVLATRRGATPEIVEATGVGFLYEPGDASGLARQVATIRRDFDAGTLNRFEISSFLESRSEKRYLEELLRLYSSSL